MKRIIVEFAGGKMDGKRYDTAADDRADREAAVALFEKTNAGQEGAVEFARPLQDPGQWQRYKVTTRREHDERILVKLTYSLIE